MSPDRPYLRSEYHTRTTSALVWLVACMVSAYLLQLVLLLPWFDKSASIPDLLRLTVRGIQQGHVWTLLSHGFLHGNNPLVIAFSLLSLILIGRELEPHLGPRRFVLLFGGALCVGAAAWLAVHWRHGGVHTGPAAGVIGLLVVLAGLHANQRMSFMPFFLFSVTVRPLPLIYAFAALDVLLLIVYELPGGQVPFGLAPSAHLGGMLAGGLYFRFLHANNGWDRAAGLTRPKWLQLPKRNRPAPEAIPPRPHPADLRADVDRILDKINSHGFGSLSDNEKRTLDTAKDLLSKN